MLAAVEGYVLVACVGMKPADALLIVGKSGLRAVTESSCGFVFWRGNWIQTLQHLKWKKRIQMSELLVFMKKSAEVWRFYFYSHLLCRSAAQLFSCHAAALHGIAADAGGGGEVGGGSARVAQQVGVDSHC